MEFRWEYKVKFKFAAKYPDEDEQELSDTLNLLGRENWGLVSSELHNESTLLGPYRVLIFSRFVKEGK